MKTFARIVDGSVAETLGLPDDQDIYTYFPESMLWVEITNISPMPGERWTYDGETFAPYVAPPPTSEQVLLINSTKLQTANQLAAAQKTALTNRIGTLQDAIDLDMATPPEVVELPLRQAQLKAWKTYAILLGRVTTQAGWHMTPEWPAQPENGMDLSVSAVGAARPATS